MDFVTNSAIGGSGGSIPAMGAFTKHLLRVMKLTAFILFACALTVSAKSVSQNTVSYSGRNVPIGKVFNEIKKQTGYVVVANKERFDRSVKIDVNAEKMAVADFMQLILEGRPWDFEIRSKTIFIKKKLDPAQPKTSELNVIHSPQGDVTGRITNAQGEPLAGASIIVKRTGKGDIADANGWFAIKNANHDDELEISFTGYKLLTVPLNGKSQLDVVLREAIDELDRAVVQGYGKTSRRLSTGNIAKVTAEEIEKQPVMNPLLALQGRVAGLEIKQNNGFVSAPVKVEIRGRNSVNRNMSGDPLYIIDGVPLTIVSLNSSSYSFLQNGVLTGPADGQSPLFNLNPLDIESVEVLKDADATSIYGSRAANGVILITTKKGKLGKTKLNVNFWQGISKVTKFYNMLDTRQYMAMRREAFQNDGILPNPTNAPDIAIWDSTSYIDWQKMLWGGTGKNTDVQAALSGGNVSTSFRIGAGYSRNTNILSVSGADQRGSLSFSLLHSSLKRKLNIAFSGQYSTTKSDMITVPAAVTLPPNTPPVFDSLGNLNYNEWQPAIDVIGFPFAELLQPYTGKTNFLNGSLTLNYNVVKGLTLRTTFGYNIAYNTQKALYPISSKNPVDAPFGEASFGYNNNKNLIVEPQIEYNTLLGQGKLELLVGGSAQNGSTQGTLLYGDGYTNDFLLNTIINAPEKFVYESYGDYKYAGLFSRVNYNLRNRYILNLSARRDGSSNFGPGNQFGNFYSAGVAWLFADETWFKNRFKLISFGKIRSSYGTTGGEGPAYGYLTRWSAEQGDYTGSVHLVPTQHANPNYRWQSNKKLEIAVNLGFAKDRVNVEAAYYNNRCGNQIVGFPTPDYTGFSSVVANSPALVENKGWEFNLTTNIIANKHFSWTVNLNAGINRNKLISYPNFELSPYTGFMEVGKSVNLIKVLHLIGVDPQSGEYTFQDRNKDGEIYSGPGVKDDRYSLELMPQYIGGMGSLFRYRNLNVSLFFNFKKQIGVNALSQLVPGQMKNMPVEVLDRWQKPGDITSIARFTSGSSQSDANHMTSDGIYTDASFVRLSNVTISYNFPSPVVSKAGMEGLNVFVNAQNLFVITKYKGIDPETQNFGGMPPARIIVAGLTFNF